MLNKLEVQATLISVNHYKAFNKGRFFIPKKTKDYKDLIKTQAIKQGVTLYVKERLSVNLRLFMGTKRRKDIDNYSKVIFDSLNGLCWSDDEQIDELYITKEYSKGNEGFILEVKEMSKDE